MKTFICANCGKSNDWKKSTTNKFCNNRCQQDFKWSETRKTLLAGTYSGNSIKPLRRLIVELYGEKCNTCGITDWLGNPISFDLDHIDGDKNHNQLSNVRLLCPNCHRQTPTWGNKIRKP